MRRIFHRCVPAWGLRDLYIFTGSGLYDLQDLYEVLGLYDLPKWNVCYMNDLYT